MSNADQKPEMAQRILELEAEVARLKSDALQANKLWPVDGATCVRVPDSMRPLFDQAQETVANYFSDVTTDPSKATIKISGERYVLLRASSLSVDFLKTIQSLYADQGSEEAFAIGRSFLFDISHVIGNEDARAFHEKMGLTEPIERLATGPVHFAYAGWAFVDISEESNPSPDENCFIKFDHPFSFEADSWLKAGVKSEHPVCIMNSGYSSGWCEKSFGVELTAVEISCKAAGDETCTFIMAPPEKIFEHVKRYVPNHRVANQVAHQIPTFFQRKRVEEEMKAAREKAEESDRLKSEFLTNVSHEIRTPMNALMGLTELVLDTKLDATQRDHLNTVLTSADSLMTIINQILDFSKIESGKLTLDETDFSLREWVSDTIRPLAVRAEPKGVVLDYQVSDGVPDNLRGDAARLRQILINLVGNAVKFTDDGSVLTAIALEESSESEVLLRFAVRDTGVGIPDDKISSVFKAFTQVDMSTTRQFGGTGLGLAIAANLVELLGGKIWVDNNSDGAGVTFHFTAKFGLGVPSAHQELAGQEVLIVADNPKHITVLEGALKKFRMNVMACDSAHDALVALSNHNQTGEPAQHLTLNSKHRRIVIADLKDNTVLVELVRSRPETRDASVVALINNEQTGDVAELKKLGVEICLTKPIKQSSLVHALKQAVNDNSIHDDGEKATDQRSDESEILGEEILGIRILLVEDGIANQKFAEAMLTRWGHSVVIANNGQEGLNMLDDPESEFDLVLMDVLMPVMDGLEATAKIREREALTGEHMPIVAVTAQAMKGDKEKCFEAGMDNYLTKPIRRRELQKLIQALTGK